MFKALASRTHRFARDRSGNIAIMFAILVIPLMGIVGAAIDYSSAYRAKSRVQYALDATALAVNRSIGTLNDDELREMAATLFAGNLGSGPPASLSVVDIQESSREVTLKATTSVDTKFMGILGIDVLSLAAASTTVAGGQTLEIAMVLDNSGSMSGRKISDLKKAAGSLADTMFGGKDRSDTIKIGVVPFAASVNVGPEQRTSPWIDSTGVSPIHFENFDADVSRFELYDNVRNEDWPGCVETRPYPLDVLDTTPTPDVPESYFVPMFAPDEPDGQNNTLNNYLNDQLDPPQGNGDNDGNGRHRGRGRSSHSQGAGSGDRDWDTAQMNVDKYFPGVTAKNGYSMSSHMGPGMMCETTPIAPLTNVRADVDRALVKMRAFGMTNIQEGLMWGWRVLSLEQPFMQGEPRDNEVNRKIIVLMTDGANTHFGINSPNMSMYSAYGYARNGRLGSPTSNTYTLVARMNERTREACENAKADDILIFTIAFDLDNSTTRDLLRDCASSSAMAFTPDGGEELMAAFATIAGELSNLRIAK
jgi:Flp pilus assembly protein TadG